jgi:hypothetical protein
MQLLCLGDLAISADDITEPGWMPPRDFSSGKASRIVFNFELPIGNEVNRIPRTSGPRLLAHPDSIPIIQKWAPGIATLATNHILDAGEQGLTNTISQLHRAGFLTVGAGVTKDEISAPLLWETQEGRVGIINWVFPETHPDCLSIPGPNCWPGLNECRSLIDCLIKQVDWILIITHWSDELFSYPRPQDREIAHELVRMGANLVIGHHPHVVRGLEIIDTCPVFYSLGNFYFSNTVDGSTGTVEYQAPRNRESLGVLVSFQRGKKPDIQMLSFWHAKGKVVIDPFRRASRRVVSVSRPFQELGDSSYAAWYASQRARFNRWEYRWYFRLWQLGLVGGIRHMFKQ